MQTGAGELAAVLGKLLERNLLIGVDPRRRVISLAVRFTLEVFNRDHASGDAGIGRRQITSGCQQVVSVAAGNHQNFGVQTVRRIYDRNRRRFDSGQELQEVGTTVIGNKSDIVLLGRLFVVVDRKFNSAPLGAHACPRSEHGGCFFEAIVGRRSKNHRQRRCGRTDGVDKRCRQNRKIVGQTQLLSIQRQVARRVDCQPQGRICRRAANLCVLTDKLQCQTVGAVKLLCIEIHRCRNLIAELIFGNRKALLQLAV